LQQPPADPACTHPCDLAQTVQINIVGDEPAASVTVTGPCGGGIADCAPLGGCRSIMLYLSNGGPGSDSGPKVCQVTAVSASGAVVERDLTASYQGSFCCSGYEFSSLAATIDFSTADAGITNPDAAGDASGG
jgi:hypothetical protein